jgi:ferric-dicitrate binding protein FerR (iron transport regulator)
VNRYSTHKLALGTGAVGDILISGLFRTGDSENFAIALTNTHPLEVRERDGMLVILAALR